VLTERQLAQDGPRDQIAHAVLAWRTELSRLLDDALRHSAGHGHPGAEAGAVDALADHVFVTFEGAFILARSLNDPSRMRAQLRVLRQLVEAFVRHRSAPVAYIAELSHQSSQNAQ
jgi:TetR/AcrR family transcriptional repressor of nem operon